MPKLILFRGLPGAGKTTLATMFCNQVLAADDFFTDDEGNYNFYKGALGEAHKQCLANTERAIIDNLGYSSHTIGVTNTFTTEKELQPYLDLAATYGIFCFSIVVENRHGNSSIHDVPQQTLDQMRNRFTVNL